MKQLSNTYRIVSLGLALLMFTTSVSFAIDMHYCGSKLKSLSFFGKAKTCLEIAHPGAKKSCPNPHHPEATAQNNGCKVDKKDCCNNKVVHYQSDQQQELQLVDFTINKQLQQFVTAFVVTFFTNTSLEREIPSFALYKPPLIPRDIPILVQSFLL